MLPLIYHPIYSELELPVDHRYPINKYRLLYQYLQRDMSEQISTGELSFIEPSPLTVDQVKQVHCPQYIEDLFSGQLSASQMRRIGFPWSQQLITRTLTSAGGTVLTAQQALKYGRAIHLSGGYHHAHREFGSGFCLINDLVLAAHGVIADNLADRVLIIDADVHQGDGSASLCHSRDDIITVSFHCEKNFPARKPASDWDVALNKNEGEEAFLTHFKHVSELAIKQYQPDLVIYDAGVDIHSEDELGFLNVSQAGIYQRDAFLLKLCDQMQIPVAAVVGGGYRTNHQDLVPLHACLIRAALEVQQLSND